MEKFLKYVVNEILKEHDISNIHSLTIIVPSERSKWHLIQQLIKCCKILLFFLKLKTIQNYFNYISNLFQYLTWKQNSFYITKLLN